MLLEMLAMVPAYREEITEVNTAFTFSILNIDLIFNII